MDKKTNDPIDGIKRLAATPLEGRRWSLEEAVLFVRGLPEETVRRLTFVAAVLVLLVVAIWIYGRFSHVYVVDARVSATIVSVGSRVPGRVLAMSVDTGDEVTQGQLLVEIDAREARLLLDELDADLRAAVAERGQRMAERAMAEERVESDINSAAAQLDAQKASLEAAKGDLETARHDFQRAEKLLKQNVISRAKWEADRNGFRKARNEHQRLRAAVATAEAQLVGAQSERHRLEALAKDIERMAHEEAQLQARRDRQQVDVENRTVLSPLDGVVDRTFVNAGEFVAPGQRLLMVHDPKKLWVSANIKETEIRHVRIDAPAQITVDAYPDEAFTGKVVRIGSAATSEFALLPSANPSGNFTKITQRLNVKIGLDKPNDLLKPGMMVEVSIDIPGR